MVALATVVLAVMFGAADQYLGSLEGHFGHFAWAVDVSLLSAPWLLLAFAAGYTQRDARRATLLGLLATMAALLGYLFMTLSPTENAHLTSAAVAGFVRSDPFTFIGGIVTGPLFGWFGHRWRVGRSWRGALVAAATLCLEPLAHIVARRPIASFPVALSEVAVGLALGLYVSVTSLRRSYLSQQSSTAR
jgi:Family of unknown function (DUF6518)